jgi:hypothetical protein
VDQILIVLSLEEVTSLRSSVILIRGSQAILVMKFLWPFKGFPTCWPVLVSHTIQLLSMPPLANVVPSGAKATNNTQPLWPSQVTYGLSVFRSQSRTVWSPDAEANFLPSGEKAHCKIASECPSSVLDALVTGLILNMASGRKVKGKIISALNSSFWR